MWRWLINFNRCGINWKQLYLENKSYWAYNRFLLPSHQLLLSLQKKNDYKTLQSAFFMTEARLLFILVLLFFSSKHHHKKYGCYVGKPYQTSYAKLLNKRLFIKKLLNMHLHFQHKRIRLFHGEEKSLVGFRVPRGNHDAVRYGISRVTRAVEEETAIEKGKLRKFSW